MGRVKLLGCLLLCSSFLMVGCQSNVDLSGYSLKDKNIVLEANDGDKHLAIEQKDGRNYVIDVTADTTADMGAYKKELGTVFTLDIPETSKGNYIEMTPCTQDNGVLCIAPNTYNSDLETSLDFISYLQSEGWEPIAIYRMESYADIYYQNFNNYLRILVTKDKLKIFSEIPKNLESSWTYTNERMK